MKRRFKRVAGRLVSFEEEDDFVPEPLRMVRGQFAEDPDPERVFTALVGYCYARVGIISQARTALRFQQADWAEARVVVLPVEWWAGITPPGEEDGQWLAWAREVFNKCGLQPPMVPSVLPLGSPVRSPEPYAYKVRFEELLMQRVHEAVASAHRASMAARREAHVREAHVSMGLIGPY